MGAHPDHHSATGSLRLPRYPEGPGQAPADQLRSDPGESDRFFRRAPLDVGSGGDRGPAVSLIPDLPDESYWLMRPCLRGMYVADALLDGRIDLEMVARCNDTIDLEAENERRYLEAMRQK